MADPSRFNGPPIAICPPSDLAHVRAAVNLATIYAGVAAPFDGTSDTIGRAIAAECLKRLFAL